uniref:CC domain-containing protein n=1 Tax=Syphacia muris TaxID=451379 RepID=A0A0N5AQ21_9BILA
MLGTIVVLLAFADLTAAITCANGGNLVATGCSNSYQCALYTNSPVACLSSQCCTVPHTCSNGCPPLALGCTSASQCLPYRGNYYTVTCINGMCCPA